MSEFATAFPNSTKVFVDGAQGVRVPMREVSLDKGEPSIRLYDTSGPQEHDVKLGLPKLREPWVAARRAASRAGPLSTRRGGRRPTARAASADRASRRAPADRSCRTGEST